VQRDGVQVVCGRFWSEIEHCGPDDLGKPDRAHAGALNQTELDQIVAKRDAEAKQRERIADATKELSGQASTIGPHIALGGHAARFLAQHPEERGIFSLRNFCAVAEGRLCSPPLSPLTISSGPVA
jgi:hypothetical protein